MIHRFVSNSLFNFGSLILQNIVHLRIISRTMREECLEMYFS